MTTTEAPSRRSPLKEKIRWAREHSRSAQHTGHISQERFATLIGTSRRHLMRIERGDNRPRQTLIVRIAEVTGHEVEFFSDEEDEEDSPVGRRHSLGGDLAVALQREIRREVRLGLASMQTAEPDRLSSRGDGRAPTTKERNRCI